MRVPALEVAGASIATVIGHVHLLSSPRLPWCCPKRNTSIWTSGRGFRPDGQALGAIWQIGAPAMLEQFVSRVGFMVFGRMVAELGTVDYATHQICINIQAMCFMNGQAFAVASTAMMGQSLGKNRADMGHAYARRTQVLGGLVALVIAALCFFYGGPLVRLFNKDPYIVETGARLLRFVALHPAASRLPVHSGRRAARGRRHALRGGHQLRDDSGRPARACGRLVFVFDMGLTGAWLALAADQLLRAALTIGRYRSARWKQIQEFNKQIQGEIM